MTSSEPALTSRAIPWRIAFSTSGWRMRLGTCASSVSAGTSIRHAQTVLKSPLLDIEIERKRNLLTKTDLGAAERGERFPEKRAESAEHVYCDIRPRARVSVAIRVERVEQKMWPYRHRNMSSCA